ncbi:MAG: sugar ABC transporter permease [Lachnospiraceae bacterium]|nr:sugar ABC transporter permease [Lachnospiraceae bacterium]
MFNPKRQRAFRRNLIAYAFILPGLLGFVIYYLIPIFAGVGFSMTDYTGLSIKNIHFVGLDNYKNMFQNSYFIKAFKNNIIYTLLYTPITLMVALFFATVLNHVKRGVKFFRVCFFLPYVTSMVSVAIVWRLIFNPTNGPINIFLGNLGISNPPKWLMSTTWALYAVIIVAVWKTFGYYMLILLAGMQTIPEHLYEAAAIDGAKAVQKFLHVTLPLLSPTIFLCIVTLVINSFQVFDLVNVMTEGGPGTATNVLVFRIYEEGFKNAKMGYACAIAYFLFVVTLAITLVQFIVQKRWVHYD